MQKSGATSWLAANLMVLGSHLSPGLLLTFFFAITALTTEILSNNAAVLLLLPIAVEVAKMLELNPFAFMFAVIFAASNSFMTPSAIKLTRWSMVLAVINLSISSVWAHL